MTNTWNYRITFNVVGRHFPNVTVQNAPNLEEAMAKAKRHVFTEVDGEVEVVKTEIKHRTGWEPI